MVDKIDFFGFTSHRGGAAKAMLRTAKALSSSSVNVTIWVVEKPPVINGGAGVVINYPSVFCRFFHFFKRALSLFFLSFMRLKNKTKYSLNLFSNCFVRKKLEKCGIKHLHWINNETLSIFDIGKVAKRERIFITLHDEWFFLGCQHYSNEDGRDNIFFGEKKDEDIKYNFSKWLDCDYIIFMLKKRVIPFYNIDFIVPSHWMKERAKKSLLLCSSEVHVVPNVIDGDVFKPRLKSRLSSKYRICFGAVNGTDNYMKGYDLLKSALVVLSQKIDPNNIELIIFGGEKKKPCILYGYECTFLGHITDEVKLADIYSSCDLTIVPSRLESFGQVAAESISCGTPVVSFETSGLIDIVEHKKTGYLAKPFCVNDLSDGISYFYYNKQLTTTEEFKMNLHMTITNRFGAEAISNQLLKIYKRKL